MRNENSDVVLQDLLKFLKEKRKEADESKAANKNGNEQIKKCDRETIV
uniref:Uncharacterized protein n=1 Tax=Arundo donax TaxID=35708 RepID=A0A0A9GQH7_ARUDO